MMREGRAGAARARGPAASLDDEHIPMGEPGDGVPTRWVRPEALLHTLAELSGEGAARRFSLLDLFCLDDALGGHTSEWAPTLVYVLQRPAPYALVRVKVRVEGEPPALSSVGALFANAAGYERAISRTRAVRFTGTTSAVHDDPLADEGTRSEPPALDLALPRALALESLLGVQAPPRAEAIRVLRAELLRVASHLGWYAALLERVGAATPASYVGADLRRAVEVLHALGGTGGGSAVPGGVERDLPAGWRPTLDAFLEEMLARARDYPELARTSPTLLGATKGVSPFEPRVATACGVTGPLLRAAGVACDLRKARPYCGYEQYAFSVPTGVHGDVYDRARVRLLELRQSLSILAQCAERMPDGPVLADVPDALVPGEAFAAVEGSAGVSACSVASDGASLFERARPPAPFVEPSDEGVELGVEAGVSPLEGDERAGVAPSAP